MAILDLTRKTSERDSPNRLPHHEHYHGAQGKGDREFGAPNLSDNDWLYGSTREDIHDQIWNGHGGVMPTWAGRLSPETIKSLAVYVHSLGGGE